MEAPFSLMARAGVKLLDKTSQGIHLAPSILGGGLPITGLTDYQQTEYLMEGQAKVRRLSIIKPLYI